MSRYVCYYSTRQTMYRELATRWMRWAATASISEIERKGVSKFFKSIAVRFGLVREFRELGII